MFQRLKIQRKQSFSAPCDQHDHEMISFFQKSNPYERQEEPAQEIDDEESQISSAAFKIQVRNHQHNKIEVEGSLRIIKIIFFLILGVIMLWTINIVLDNKCQEKYLDLNCMEAKPLKECEQVMKCLSHHKDYYFSLEQNLVIAISFIGVLILTICPDSFPRLRIKLYGRNKDY